MAQWPDPTMREALQRGDDEAFAQIYDRYASSLYRMALSLTGSQAIAEDAVQEVFTTLVRRRDQLHEIRNLRSYLFSAVHKAARQQRRRWLRIPLPESADPPAREETGPDTTISAELETALSRLPGAQREVVLLKIDGEFTFDEIAQMLQISSNTAASRYRYAMEKLRQWVSKT